MSAGILRYEEQYWEGAPLSNERSPVDRSRVDLDRSGAIEDEVLAPAHRLTTHTQREYAREHMPWLIIVSMRTQIYEHEITSCIMSQGHLREQPPKSPREVLGKKRSISSE